MASASRQTPSVTICPYYNGKKHTQCFVIQTKWQKILQVLAKITTYTLWKKIEKGHKLYKNNSVAHLQKEKGSAREKQGDRQDIF